NALRQRPEKQADISPASQTKNGPGLFLRGDLLIGFPPSTDFQPPANPAQVLVIRNRRPG
ncbi:MAG: hypothetical protein ACJ74Y_09580, partial [Bryobacteraceae bacterium]